jgi:hypothetical protein
VCAETTLPLCGVCATELLGDIALPAPVRPCLRHLSPITPINATDIISAGGGGATVAAAWCRCCVAVAPFFRFVHRSHALVMVLLACDRCAVSLRKFMCFRTFPLCEFGAEYGLLCKSACNDVARVCRRVGVQLTSEALQCGSVEDLSEDFHCISLNYNGASCC